MQNKGTGEMLQVFNSVRKNIQENREIDLFQKAFLKPTEICLKTRSTQNDKNKPLNSLPYGLKNVWKEDISLDKYELKDFQPFQELSPQNQNYPYVSKYHYNNLVSVFKSNTRKLQVGICICMYSEEKQMLTRTLSGVRQNIATFIKNGVRPDQIAVCLILDGIDFVHESLIGFFEQLQKQNGIYMSKDEQPIKVKDLLEDDFEDFEIRNLNDFIFKKEQAQERKKRMFEERYRQYQDMKVLIKKIEELQKLKILTYDMLQPMMQPIFRKIAYEKRKQDYAQDDKEVQRLGNEFLIKEYGNSKPILWQVLIETRIFCEKYFRSRENFALMHYYRTDVSIPGSQNENQNDNSNNVSKNDISQNHSLKMENSSLKNIHDAQFNEQEKNPKMNLFVITKYKNNGKLSSHNWFFNGFCQQIKFKYTVLLDVGLCPQKKALYRMYKSMVEDKDVGGVCGYMGIRIQRVQEKQQIDSQAINCITALTLKFFDIQRAQQLEYHLSHLIDKPFEATFNFIHVLPGAFSAYRMDALYKNYEQKDSELLTKYFKSLDDTVGRGQLKIQKISACNAILKVLLPDIFYNCCFKHTDQNKKTDWQVLQESNVYLAEDRTLCMGIHQNGYKLKYVPNAHAWVDPMKTLHGLFGQRKRWINGSYFAFEMVKKQIRKGQGNCCLYPQFAILELLNSLAFISPALFLFTISIAMNTIQLQVMRFLISGLLEQGNITAVTDTVSNFFTYTINFIYTLFFLGLVFYSMFINTKNRRFLSFIYLTSSIFGILSFIVMIVLLVDIIEGLSGDAEFLLIQGDPSDIIAGGQVTIDSLRYLIIGSMAFYVFPVLIYSIAYKRFSSLVQIVFGSLAFIFYAPTYLNILSVYALCRIDDFSWGTKGLTTDNDVKNTQIRSAWKTIKVIYVAKFVFWNVVSGVIFVSLSSGYSTRFFFTYGFLALIALFLIIKIIFAVIYLLKQSCASYEAVGPIDKTDCVQAYFGSMKKSLYEQVQSNVCEIYKNDRLRFRKIVLTGQRKPLGGQKYRKSR